MVRVSTLRSLLVGWFVGLVAFTSGCFLVVVLLFITDCVLVWWLYMDMVCVLFDYVNSVGIS